MSRGPIQTMTDEVERLYYQIGDAADMLHVAPSAIRFWEKEFELDCHRNRKGDRRYTVPEVAFLKLISEAVEDLKIETVKRLLKEGGEERLQEVVDKLKEKKDDGAIAL